MRKRHVAAALGLALAAGGLGAAPAWADEEPPIDFQLPFDCGEEWRLDHWAHAPALDMVKEPDQQGTAGSPVLASADGEVMRSELDDYSGNIVRIDHGSDYWTTYIHLDSRSVEVGDTVAQGDQIGTVGEGVAAPSTPICISS